MDVIRYPCLKINCPELFADPEFAAWLKSRSGVRPPGEKWWTPVATWHEGDEEMNEYSDVFCTYEDGEGSDSDMPEHCWERLCELARREVGSGFAILWLTNPGE